MSDDHSVTRWQWLFTQRIAADTMPPPEWFLKDHPEYRAVGVFLDHDPSYKSPDIPGQWSLWQLDENRLDEKLQQQADDDGMRVAPEPRFRVDGVRLAVIDERFFIINPGGWKADLLKGFIPFEPIYKDND